MVKTLSSEREIYKTRVSDCEDKLEALEAEKAALLSKKDEAIASANSLFDATVAARVDAEGKLAQSEEKIAELSGTVHAFRSNLEGMKTEIEIRSVDRYKTSPAFDAFMHREFKNGIQECRNIVESNLDSEAQKLMDLTIQSNASRALQSLRDSRKLWLAHCRSWGLPVLDMHMEIPNQSGLPKVYTAEKPGSSIFGLRIDAGPDVDYELSDGEENLVLSEKAILTSVETNPEDHLSLAELSKKEKTSQGPELFKNLQDPEPFKNSQDPDPSAP
ncbi:hypothetical protein ACOSQ2_001965 [Xanthoceras sorbifolium]